MRPYYQLTKMTKLVAELGWFADKREAKPDEKGVKAYTSKHGSKYTLVYAICPDASNFWSRPEFRIYASYVHGNEYGQDYSTYGSTGGTVEFKDGYKKTYSGSNNHDFLFGVMGEAWW